MERVAVPGDDTAAGQHGCTGQNEARTFRGLTGRVYRVEPEHALLLRTANVYADVAGDERVSALLAGRLRWDRVLDRAQAHGVMGLLRRALRQAGHWEAVPEDARRAMDAWHRTQQLKHFSLAQQLAVLLADPALAGIDLIFLKGAAVAATGYPDPTLRSMVDVDVLVARSNFQTVAGALQRQGYRRKESFYYTDEFNSARGYHYVFLPPVASMFPIEVHWDLSNQLERHHRLNAAAIQGHTARARVVMLSGVASREAHVLAPEAHLAHLATHAATGRHAFGELKWLADVAAIAGAPSTPDWAQVARFARDVQASTAVYVALALARNLVGAPVPEPVLEELRPGRRTVWALERNLEPARILDPLTEDRRSVVKYFTVDGRATRVRLLREHLLPPPDAMRAYYPRLSHMGMPVTYTWHVTTLGTAAVRKAGAWLLR